MSMFVGMSTLFVCESVKDGTVKFSVAGKDKNGHDWGRHNPHGTISIGVEDQMALGSFIVGEQYIVKFHKA